MFTEDKFFVYTNPLFYLYVGFMGLYYFITKIVWNYTTIEDWYVYHFKLESFPNIALEMISKMDSKVRWFFPHKAWINKYASKKAKTILKQRHESND